MKMNMVFVVYSLRAGGAEAVISRLSNFFSKDHEVSILLLSNISDFYKLESNVEIIKTDFPKPTRFSFFYYYRMARHIRKNIKKIKPDAVFSFMESINSFVLLSLLFIKTKKFVSNRASPLSSLRGFRGLVNPLIYPLADGVIVQTQKAVEILKPKYKKSRFVVIPNPILAVNEVSPVLKREKIIISVGFLGGRKNQHLLIDYFSKLRNALDWKLALVGDGPNREALEKQAKDLGFAKRIIFTGNSTNVAALLANAQIFAFTSATEGFPNALAEGLAAGCACISFDCITGPSELISDGENGFLVALDNHEHYIRKLNELTEKDTLRQKFSQAGVESVKKYEIEKIAERYKKLV